MITERIEFDISQSEEAIAKLDRSLSEATQSFKVNLADALDVLNGVQVAITPPDTAPITDAIDQAVQAADQQATVTVEGKVDEASITGPIDQAVQAADTTVVIEADTSAAQEAVTSLGTSAEGATGQVEGLKTGVEAFGVAAGVAEGSGKELLSFFGGLGEGAGVAAAGIGTLAAATGGLFAEAVSATGAEQRFNAVLGDQADAFKNINVAGLHTQLDALAQSEGTTAASIENVSSSLIQFGQNAGASSAESQKFAQDIIALSARAVGLNPTLGDLGSVADTLGTRLARGRTIGLVPYGISLSTAEVNARALANTHKSAATDLEPFEKAIAATQIALDKYGSSIDKDVTQGTGNAVLQLASLKAEFQNALEEISKKVEAPVFTLLHDSLPIAVAFADGISQVATSALPLLTDALRSVEPTIGLFVGGLEAVAPVLDTLDNILNAIPGPIITGVATFFLLSQAIERLGPISTAAFDLAGLGAFKLADSAVTARIAVESLVFAEEKAVTSHEAAAAATEADAVAQEQLALALDGEIGVYEQLTFAVTEEAVAAEASAAATEVATASMGLLTPLLLAATVLYAGYVAITGSANENDTARKKVVDDLTKAFEDNTKSIESNIQANLDAQKDKTLLDALNASGQTFDDFSKAIAGGIDAQLKFQTQVVGTARALGASDQQQGELDAKLRHYADSVELAAHNTLDHAVASGTLTKAQEDAAIAANTGANGYVNYAAALQRANPIIADAEQHQKALATAHDQVTTTLNDLIKKNDDYNTALELSGKKTPELANAFENVTSAASDPILALTNLSSAISDAGLSTDEMKTIAAGLGISASELDGFVKAVKADVDALDQAVSAKLPTISSVTDELIKTAASNQSQADSLNKQAEQAAQKAADASVAVEGETAKQATARLATVAKFNETANDLRAQAANLQTALDPTDLLSQLDKSIQTTQDFQSNLDFLVNSKFPELAKIAAEKGPDFAQALVDKIKNSPDDIGKTLEQKLQDADHVAQDFKKHFHDVTAQEIVAELGAAGLGAGAAFSVALSDGLTLPDTIKLQLQAQAAGEAIKQGLADGLSSSVDLMIHIGQAAGDQVNQGFRNAAHLSSPSKVWQEFGNQLNAGLVIGLQESGSEVVLAAEQIAKDAAKAVQSQPLSLNFAPALAPVTVPTATAPPLASPTAGGVSTAPGLAPTSGPLIGEVNITTTDPLAAADATAAKILAVSNLAWR